MGRIAEMNAERYAAWSVKRYGMEGLPEEPKPTYSGATQCTLGETWGMILRQRQEETGLPRMKRVTC